MKKAVSFTALALAFAVVVGCGKPGVEEYKPAAGQPADCSKYTLEVNRVKCQQAEGRH